MNIVSGLKFDKFLLMFSVVPDGRGGGRGQDPQGEGAPPLSPDYKKFNQT